MEQYQIQEQKEKSAMEFAINTIHGLPKGDPEAIETHLTSVLVVFMGALWGTMGTDYARDFIQAQLDSMRPGVEVDRFTPPPMQ